MYAKAMRGELKEFTGVSDPYEAPDRPELHLKTHEETPEESAEKVMRFLAERGYVAADKLAAGTR
jgi:adenylylsulfate kinase